MDVLASPPTEQLYDLKTDPYEFHNLATSLDPLIQDRLVYMRRQMQAWREKTRDL